MNSFVRNRLATSFEPVGFEKQDAPVDGTALFVETLVAALASAALLIATASSAAYP